MPIFFRPAWVSPPYIYIPTRADVCDSDDLYVVKAWLLAQNVTNPVVQKSYNVTNCWDLLKKRFRELSGKRPVTSSTPPQPLRCSLTREHWWGAPTPSEGRSAHPISVLSGFGGKLPLPFYADVRLYIPMTHHYGLGLPIQMDLSVSRLHSLVLHRLEMRMYVRMHYDICICVQYILYVCTCVCVCEGACACVCL